MDFNDDNSHSDSDMDGVPEDHHTSLQGGIQIDTVTTVSAVVAFLKNHGIPEGYCKEFEGKGSSIQ